MKQEDIEKIADYLASLAERRFFGRVVLAFQNGQIDTIRTESTQRIEHLGAAAPGERPPVE